MEIMTSASCMVHDDESIHVDPRDSPLTPIMLLASLAQMIRKLQSKPRELIFWPAVHGAVRIRHLQTFVSTLQPLISSCQISLLPAQEPNNTAPDSCTKAIFLMDKTNPEVKLFCHDDSFLVRFLEERLTIWEDGIQEMTIDNSASFSVPCLTQTLPLSVIQLQQLFQASTLFHEAKPWDLLSNFNPVKLAFPKDYKCSRIVCRHCRQWLVGWPRIVFLQVSGRSQGRWIR